MSATPLLLNVFIFQRINGIFFFDLMHCIDHGCKDHKKYAECCNKLLLLYSFTFLLGTIVVTAIVRAATVVATTVSTVVVLVIVLVALDIGVIAEIVVHQGFFVKENSASERNEKSNVNQFFHILNSVAMPKGSVRSANGFEYMHDSSCCNADSGIVITAIRLKPKNVFVELLFFIKYIEKCVILKYNKNVIMGECFFKTNLAPRHLRSFKKIVNIKGAFR